MIFAFNDIDIVGAGLHDFLQSSYLRTVFRNYGKADELEIIIRSFRSLREFAEGDFHDFRDQCFRRIPVIHAFHMKDVDILVGTGGKISGLSVSGKIRKSPRTPCGATIRPTIIFSSGFISVTESDDLSVFNQNFAAG